MRSPVIVGGEEVDLRAERRRRSPRRDRQFELRELQAQRRKCLQLQLRVPVHASH